MGKSSKSLFIGALASTLLSGVAFSADYIPAPVIDFEPEYEAEFGGNLYLRGYIGFTNQQVDSLDNALFRENGVFAPPDRIEFLSSEFDAGGLAGIALGYRFNQWFRGDISAEYRMRTRYHGVDRTDGAGGAADTWDGTNTYTADKSEFVVMANAFVDMGTYHGLTPYVGAGVGATYTMIDNFVDTGVGNVGGVLTNSLAYGQADAQLAFAWALHAGLGYEVNDRITLDLGYRYLRLGDASTTDLVAFDGSNALDNPMHFEGISSHDVTFGFRYALGPVGGGHGTGYGGGSSSGMLSY